MTHPDHGLFFQQGDAEKFSISRPLPRQCLLVDPFHQRRQLERHVMLMAGGSRPATATDDKKQIAEPDKGNGDFRRAPAD